MEQSDHRLAAVIFTDIAGFSAMMGSDEAGTLQTLEVHNQLVREQIRRHRGTEIKTIGDAFLAHFPTTIDAVLCAVGIQNSIQEYNSKGTGKPLALRIGVHVGDIYFYEKDALGEGVNIASRLQALAKPGNITISREVYSQISGKIPLKIESLGQVQLKNITREVFAYEILQGTPTNSQENPGAAQASGSSKNDVSPRELKETINDYVTKIVRQSLDDSLDQRSRRRARRRRRDLERSAETSLTEPGQQSFADYKAKVLEKAESSRHGWWAHLRSFVFVNTGLFAINWFTSPHPLALGNAWFLFPLLGWGIGLLGHAAGYRNNRRKAREVSRITELDGEALATFQRYQHERGSLSAHLWSNVGISALLAWIWLFAGGGFPWPLIPIAALAAGVFSRLGSFWKLRKKNLFGEKNRKRDRSTLFVEPDSRVVQAQELYTAIIEQMKGLKGENPLGENFDVSLKNYVRQIGELSAVERELGKVVRSAAAWDGEAEAVEFREKAKTAQSPKLKAEYLAALEGVEQQKKSAQELGETQELLNLRIGSALKSLAQMQMD
ncbi:MAG: adenylate/guanylate cyclase domain-containing protein, partial [Spirochaetales bacterium]|nr:adenylate/guanylate cyclase domain-containing protein [Spirochaetales bacterium]